MADTGRYVRELRATAKEAMLQGREFEQEAERCRLEAEQAFADAGAMKAEGLRRAAVQNPRMLPSHQRAIDVKTNSFKAMQDAKGDFVVYLDTRAATYAALAQMKYAKATALLAEIRTRQGRDG